MVYPLIEVHYTRAFHRQKGSYMNKSRKFTTILLFITILSLPLSALRYKFDYDLISDIRKTYALLYKFRLYYHASASAYFNSWSLGNGKQAFRFAGIADSGYRVRTHRRGQKLSVVTAATTFAQAEAAYNRRIASFRKESPFYSRMIETIAKRPFQILPTTPQSIRFDREINGTFDGYGFALQMIKPSSMPVYSDSFNIYKLLLEMVKAMSHKALPGNTLASLPQGATATWQGPWLNYGAAFSKISLLADYKGRKYFKYAQAHSFRMTYRVLSRSNGKIIVSGVGYPFAEIGMNMKIRMITRTITYRASDGLLLNEQFKMSATTSDKLGWTLRANLTLL